jgi:hypothetical protein
MLGHNLLPQCDALEMVLVHLNQLADIGFLDA